MISSFDMLKERHAEWDLFNVAIYDYIFTELFFEYVLSSAILGKLTGRWKGV
jgi:hypothetical protein